MMLNLCLLIPISAGSLTNTLREKWAAQDRKKAQREKLFAPKDSDLEKSLDYLSTDLKSWADERIKRIKAEEGSSIQNSKERSKPVKPYNAVLKKNILAKVFLYADLIVSPAIIIWLLYSAVMRDDDRSDYPLYWTNLIHTIVFRGHIAYYAPPRFFFVYSLSGAAHVLFMLLYVLVKEIHKTLYSVLNSPLLYIQAALGLFNFISFLVLPLMRLQKWIKWTLLDN